MHSPFVYMSVALCSPAEALRRRFADAVVILFAIRAAALRSYVVWLFLADPLLISALRTRRRHWRDCVLARRARARNPRLRAKSPDLTRSRSPVAIWARLSLKLNPPLSRISLKPNSQSCKSLVNIIMRSARPDKPLPHLPDLVRARGRRCLHHRILGSWSAAKGSHPKLAKKDSLKQ